MPAGAVVQQAEKTENAPFFACYPDYDATADSTTNYTIRWMDDDFSLSFAQVDADTLAQAYVDYAAELERAQGRFGSGFFVKKWSGGRFCNRRSPTYASFMSIFRTVCDVSGVSLRIRRPPRALICSAICL